MNTTIMQACLLQGGQITLSPAVKEGHQIMALFQLPSLTNQYRSKADEYLSHLVGHEGKGRLLSALKAKGWASELSAGIGDSGYDRNTAAYVFEVHITLTEAGLAAHPGTLHPSLHQSHSPCLNTTPNPCLLHVAHHVSSLKASRVPKILSLSCPLTRSISQLGGTPRACLHHI